MALEVNNVSPFSSWAIESDKLKHDSRIIALNDKKKQKQLFDNWCIEKSEKLLAEQKSSQKDSKAGFLDLLSEQVINPRFRYDDFCRRFKKDLRFMKFEDLKERQILFERQILNLKESLKAEARKNFLEMLKESKLHVFSTWMETSMKLENDPRFETLKNPIDRENQFRNFIKGLRKSEQN